jgi:hypothetical protein
MGIQAAQVKKDDEIMEAGEEMSVKCGVNW